MTKHTILMARSDVEHLKRVGTLNIQDKGCKLTLEVVDASDKELSEDYYDEEDEDE